MQYETQDTVPFEWQVGDVILGKYEIRDIFGDGGMGLVYRSYHREWKIELAIKTPRENFFKTQEQIDSFKSEAEKWISVGMHPNVTTCFYVQNLGNSPRIFAEFVEGGSLSDWINARKFDLASEMEKSRLIIGVAIQFARGLEHAHNKGLIHQDVKPANVLMTPDGSPKVTDFGLANARIPERDARAGENSDKTIYVKSAGFLTEAYASPEQAAGKPLSRKTDIWSWAVSILEILNGSRDWSHGQAAPFALETLFEERIHTDPIACLLSDCFAWIPEDRPSDFGVIIRRLNEIYKALFDEEYPDPIKNLIRLSVDSLNNHAVSLIELGKGCGSGETGLSCLYELRELDKRHALGRLNLMLLKWRTGMISSSQMTKELDSQIAQPDAINIISEIWIFDYYNEVREYRKAINFSIEKKGISNEIRELTLCAFWKFKLHFLETFNNLNNEFRDRTIKKFNLDADEIHHERIEASAAEFGVVRYFSDFELIVCNIHFGSVLLKSQFPHMRTFTISQDGSVLLVLMDAIAENEKKTSTYTPFTLSLIDLKSGNKVDLPSNFELPAPRYCCRSKLTVTDNGQSASIWIPTENGWSTVDYEFSRDSSEWRYSYDFRHNNTVLIGAELIRMSSCGGHLIATQGSHIQVWHTEQTRISCCILDIDLCDYGIINTKNYLPNFFLEPAWDFEIDHWNIFDVLHSIRRLPQEMRAPYIIVRPPTWGESLKQWNELQDTLNEIKVIEKAIDARKLLERIDECLKLGFADKSGLLDKRHSIVSESNDCFLAGAWLEDSVDQYWDSDIVGVTSESKNSFTFKRYRKLSRVTIGKVEERIDARIFSESIFFRSKKYKEYKRCFGLCFLNNDHSLYLMHRGYDDLCCKIALLQEQDSCGNYPIAEWDVNLDFKENESPDGIQKRREFDWFECINNRIFYRDSLKSICIRDVETGEIISVFNIDDSISMIKKVEFNGIECLAIGTARNGVVYLLDQHGKLLQLLDLNSERGGYVEDISYFCTDAILMTQNHVWIHVNLLKKSSAIVSNTYWEDLSKNRIHRNQRFRISRCGKAVVADDGISASIIDLKNGIEILKCTSRSPTGLGASPCFDISGRWLVMPHSVNHYDIYELFWNI